ncbi:baeRF3 domain-containing protein [Rhodocyclaceae bacterium SMB388]
MTLLTDDFAAALEGAEPPCLSLYQPTHRSHPANQQDPIRFRNLLKALEQSLRQQYPDAEIASLLAPFEALADDETHWKHTLDGLVVFAAPGLFQVLATQRPVEELVVVANSFHTKPLRRLLQSAGRYQVLGLSRDAIRLFEGNREALDEIDLVTGVPRTITEALGDELTDKHQTVASYGGAGPGSTPMHHGHGGKSDELDVDGERFFRAVDHAVLERYSQPSGLPLILAALPEHHALFHRISKNPHLVKTSVTVNPDAVSIEELRARAWEVVEPQYRARLAALGEVFGRARAHELGSDDLAEVAAAAAAGRVETLLIEADRLVPGHLDETTGQIVRGELDDPMVDDLLDDLGEMVASMGGQVWVVPAENMPVPTGVAATFRF